MNITQKIYSGFLAPLLMLLILGIWGVVVSGQVSRASQEAQEVGFKLAMQAKEMELHVVQVQQWLTDISATRAAQGYDDGFSEAEEHAKGFESSVESFSKYAREQNDTAQLQELEALKQRFQNFYAMGRKMAQAYIDGGPPKGNAMMKDFDEHAESFTELLKPFLEKQIKLAHDNLSSVKEHVEFLRTGILFILLIALVAVGVLGWKLGRSLTQPIHEMVSIMEQIGNGDLTLNARQDERKDELGLINTHINRLVRIFGGNIRQINLQAANITAFVSEILTLRKSIGTSSHDLDTIARSVADQNHALIGEIVGIKSNVDQSVANLEALHQASQHVTEGINTIASATEQANASVSSMANSAQHMLGNIETVHDQLTEVHDAIASVANSAEQMKLSLDEVRQRCLAAVQESETARDRASEAEAVMEKLSSSAHEIGTVVEIINHITEQTFMLALNAAIEAAGAGEAGKGFAVVANEVKELARQTAEATLMIQGQIEAIRDQTREAKEKTDIIHESVERISSANAAINQSVTAQSQATDQIVQATGKVAQATAEVNSGAEELQNAAIDVVRAAEQAALGSQEIASSAERIANSAQEMEDRTRSTVESAQAIQLAAERTDRLAGEVREKADNSLRVVETMHGIVNQFQAMGDVVGGISEALYAAQARMDVGPEPFNIRRIKEAVLSLMYRLNLAIATRDPSLAAEEANPDNCPVDRWLNDEVQGQFRTLPLYAKMDATHRQLHQTSLDILRFIELNQPDAVQESMTFFHELRRVFFEQLNQLYLGGTDDQFANTPLIRWRDSLSVGVQAFDVDHKNLIEQINQLNVAMDQKQGAPQLQSILDELINYATTHFTREERLLNDHGYDGVTEQHHQHVKFINYIREQNRELSREDSFALASELLKFLKDWLLQHILKHDMGYKAFLAAKGVK
ncbi:MAG: bacteriohemerythrin [Magnetococcales bacterium]|nr:bacteriohemerythrin [Magnetococcales bacterium]